MLSSLADDSWQQLDLAGCSKLYGAELLAAAAKMPKLAALDVTGGQLQSEGGWNVRGMQVQSSAVSAAASGQRPNRACVWHPAPVLHASAPSPSRWALSFFAGIAAVVEEECPNVQSIAAV